MRKLIIINNLYNLKKIFNKNSDLEGIIEKKYFLKSDLQIIDSNNLIIRLTIKQLIYVGIHIGHLQKNSELLSSWIFYSWRDNIFLISLIKTVILTRIGLEILKQVIWERRPFWFVTMNMLHGPYISRYASICGEPFNIFWWIGGTLTNVEMILSWHSLLVYTLEKQKYIFRHQDRKKLQYFHGFFKQPIDRINEGSNKGERVYIFKKRDKLPTWRMKFSETISYKKLNKMLAQKEFGSLKPLKFLATKGYSGWVELDFFNDIWRKPGGGFVPTFLDNWRIVDEFALSEIPFMTLIDSNIRSGEVLIPLPSNDDSLQCIMFFTYLITKNIFASKVRIAREWNDKLINKDKTSFNKLRYKFIFLKTLEEDYQDKKIDISIVKFNELLFDVMKKNISQMNIKNLIEETMFVEREILGSKDYKFDYDEFFSLKFKQFKI